jgi:YVTN family beta-propeller protein
MKRRYNVILSACAITASFAYAQQTLPQAPVAYIVNCCNYSSTVGVYATSSNRQKGEWNVGTNAIGAVFSPDGATAYVANEGTRGSPGLPGSITVVDASSGATVTTIPVGYYLQWMVISSDGSKLYVDSYDSAYYGHVVAIDTATNTVSQVIEVSDILGPMALTPDGSTMYIAFWFPGNGNPEGVLVIDTASLSVITTIPIGISGGLAITPDGKYVYAGYSPSSGPGDAVDVAVIDTSTNSVVATIPLSPSLGAPLVQISPDGSMVWVSESGGTNSANSFITVIQTATNQVSGTISLLGGLTPGSIVFAPDGKQAYVAAFPQPVVEVVDVSTMAAVAEIYPLSNPSGLAVSPDGTTLLIPNTGTTRTTAVSESKGSLLASIPVGDSGDQNSGGYIFGGVALAPGGARAYVTNYISGNLSVVDTGSKTVITNVPALPPGTAPDFGPAGVVVAPDGSKVYVVNSPPGAGSSVAVIDTQTFTTAEISFPQYPSSIAISPDGQRLYVAGASAGTSGASKGFIFTVDTSSNEVLNETRVWNPGGLTMSPDGANIYLMCGSTSTYLCTFSTATNTITNMLKLASASLGFPPYPGTAITPDGNIVFIDGAPPSGGADSNQVFEVDVQHNRLVRTITVGTQPGAMAITPDHSQLWVCDYSSTSVSIVDVQTGAVTKAVPLGNQSYAIAFGPH